MGIAGSNLNYDQAVALVRAQRLREQRRATVEQTIDVPLTAMEMQLMYNDAAHRVWLYQQSGSECGLWKSIRDKLAAGISQAIAATNKQTANR